MRAAILLLTGCLDIRAYPGGGTPLDATGDGNACVQSAPDNGFASTLTNPAWTPGSTSMPGGSLTGGKASLVFADGTFALDGYAISGTPLLATDPVKCMPSKLGVLLAPGDTSDSAGTWSLSGNEAGAAFSKVTSTWSYDGSCNAIDVRSDWYAFPDGRLTRADRLVANASGATTTCACSPNGSGKSAALAGRFTSELTTVVASGGHPIESDQDVELPICFDGPSFGLVVVGPSTQTTHVVPSASSYASVFAQSATGLQPDTTATLSYIPIPPGQCSAALVRFAGFAHGVALQVDGMARSSTSPDGIAGGATQGFQSTSATTTLTVPSGPAAPPGFTFAIGFPSSGIGGALKVRRNGMLLDSDHVRIQTRGSVAVIWLRDGFGGDVASCDQIAVEQ